MFLFHESKFNLTLRIIKYYIKTFILKFEEPTFTNTGVITSYKKWALIDEETGNVKASANQDIVVGTEKYITNLGLNIKIKQASNPGADPTNIENNGAPWQFSPSARKHWAVNIDMTASENN